LSRCHTAELGLAAAEAFHENVIILGNERHQTSYTIKEVSIEDGATTLGFGDVLFLVGMGEVVGTDQATETVASDRRLTGGGRTEGGRHAGRWLYNDDKSKGARIASISGKAIKLEGVDADLDETFRDANGDGRRQYWISDIGPGDTFRIPTVTYCMR